MNVNSAKALIYANHGVAVFPCRETGGPHGAAKSPYVARGYLSATTDPQQLNRWFEQFPAAVYGLPCDANGIFVLDADRHGNGDGVSNAMAVFARQGFDSDSVPKVRTPNDGLHFLFRKPVSLGQTKGRIADAVDVRDKGYVIAAGMTLADGRRYSLLGGTIEELAFAIGTRSLPVMPDWLGALALKPAPTIRSFSQPATPELVHNQLRGLVRIIVRATIGNRNRVLFWAACRAAELVGHGLIGADAALALLVEAGRHAGLGGSEARATVISGLRQGHPGSCHGC